MEEISKINKFQFGDYACSITENIPDANDKSIHIPEKEYDKMMYYDKIIYQWLLNKNNLTRNRIDTQSIINQLPIGPICGYFDMKPNGNEFNCVDMYRAYTTNVYNMENFPVFNEFDEYLPYDGHDIEDYTNCLCELLEYDNLSAIYLICVKYSDKMVIY